jgi:phosphopantothenoylcysteine decarboxylase/phosphopantothenate--cysteine ligase
MAQKSVLLIISGSIAAYKMLELIRRLRERGVVVRSILTKSGEKFVTPFSVAALSENPVYNDLWSLKDETEMGHIRLSREADLVVVAPASADIIAKMAQGLADDLASAALLANNKPLLVAPAMNSMMWQHPATRRNVKQLKEDGAEIIEPASGMLACGEVGAGRMAEVEIILQAILQKLEADNKHLSDCLKNPQHTTPVIPAQAGIYLQACTNGEMDSRLRGNDNNLGLFIQSLTGYSAIVTAGPTFEAIDPVRFLGNHSSGKQGYAIAEAFAAAGAKVTLISGRTALPDPKGVTVLRVTSALEMLAAVEDNLPADIAVCAAAVSDFRPAIIGQNKIKKRVGETPVINLVENPDILKTLSSHKNRPQLVIGFAAETENLVENAHEKLKRKGCDFILANDVSGGKVFEQDSNEILFVSEQKSENWGKMSKQEIARKLVDKIIAQLAAGKVGKK